MNNNLPEFIRFLEENEMASLDIDGEDESHFENRFKIQKYVFFAKLFGLDAEEYKYDIYLYGPYSENLGTDYFMLARNPDEYANHTAAGNTKGLGQFKAVEFLAAIKDKSMEWLEIAATLVDQNSYRRTNREDLVKNVAHIKDHIAGGKYVSNVLSDLERLQMIKCLP